VHDFENVAKLLTVVARVCLCRLERLPGTADIFGDPFQETLGEGEGGDGSLCVANGIRSDVVV
jgi:hypothetical protein